jgi:hypothetical protein
MTIAQGFFFEMGRQLGFFAVLIALILVAWLLVRVLVELNLPRCANCSRRMAHTVYAATHYCARCTPIHPQG